MSEEALSLLSNAKDLYKNIDWSLRLCERSKREVLVGQIETQDKKWEASLYVCAGSLAVTQAASVLILKLEGKV